MSRAAHVRVVVVLGGVFALTAAPARAELTAPPVCAEHIDDPVGLPWREGGVDVGRGGCLHADVSVRLGGRALIDTPDFYGTLTGDATIAARFIESERLEWGVALRVLDATFVQNAVLEVDELGYGPVSAHLALARDQPIAGRPTRGAAFVRVELPFTRSRLDGSTGAVQLGLATTTRLGERLRLHGRAAVLGWYASSTAGRDGRAAGLVSVDVGWRAVSWLALFVGADAQLGWYGVGLDHLAARGGGHWRAKGLWRVELAAGRALAGAERTDLSLGLALRRDLD